MPARISSWQNQEIGNYIQRYGGGNVFYKYAHLTVPCPSLTLPYPTLPYPTLPYPTLPYQVWRASADEHSNLSTRLLQSNPILEATGNAKTARHSSSMAPRRRATRPTRCLTAWPHCLTRLHGHTALPDCMATLPHCTAWPHCLSTLP